MVDENFDLKDFGQYKTVQSKIGNPQPPCVKCTLESYLHCRDYLVDCKAFRGYVVCKQYSEVHIGRNKRLFEVSIDPRDKQPPDDQPSLFKTHG